MSASDTTQQEKPRLKLTDLTDSDGNPLVDKDDPIALLLEQCGGDEEKAFDIIVQGITTIVREQSRSKSTK